MRKIALAGYRHPEDPFGANEAQLAYLRRRKAKQEPRRAEAFEVEHKQFLPANQILSHLNVDFLG